MPEELARSMWRLFIKNNWTIVRDVGPLGVWRRRLHFFCRSEHTFVSTHVED